MADTGPPVRNYVRIKVVSLGDSGVGKSCLIKRYCEKKFVAKYISTIGVDFGVRQVPAPNGGGGDLKVNFWDLSGSSDLYEVRKDFHAGAQGIMLVYDVTDAASFHSLPRWMSEHTTHGGSPLVVLLCANKVDEPQRAISESEGRKFASMHGYTYVETSAKSGQNVDAMFAAIFKGIVDKTNTNTKG